MVGAKGSDMHSRFNATGLNPVGWHDETLYILIV